MGYKGTLNYLIILNTSWELRISFLKLKLNLKHRACF